MLHKKKLLTRRILTNVGANASRNLGSRRAAFVEVRVSMQK
jgi:hypothetical protein